jgi:hypothetical protein
MKKNIFFAIIFTGFFFVCKAQKNNVEYGFQAGANCSWAYGKYVARAQNSVYTGFHLGGHFKKEITRHFGVKAILAYDQIGSLSRPLVFENSTSTGLVNGEAINKLGYLDLPVLAEWAFGNKVKFNVNAGFFVGYLLKNTLIIKTDEPGVPQKSSSASRRSMNFGTSFGTGIQVPIKHAIKLDIGIQDNLGLSKTYKGGSTTKINSFSITGGLTFTLK